MRNMVTVTIVLLTYNIVLLFSAPNHQLDESLELKKSSSKLGGTDAKSGNNEMCISSHEAS